MQPAKRLTEGALLSGLFIVMLFLALFVPFVMTIVLWFLPLPFIVYTARHGWRAGLLMMVVTVLLSFFIGGIIGFPNALLAGSGGVTAGALIRRKKEAFFVTAASSLAYIGVLILLYAATILIINIDPLAALQDVMRQSVEQAESMLGAMGQEGSQDLETFQNMIEQIGYLGPLLIVATGIIYAVISQMIAHVVMRRLGMKYLPFPAFRNWNFPRALLWYYLVTSVIFLIGVEEGTALYIVIWNLMPLLETIMALQGFTVMFYYAYVKGLPKALPIVLLVAGLILPIVLLLARILGIIDLGFQLKKRMESSN
ncbi:Uncharacterized conserved protein YybS, DUF2232 family [Alteribacillus iranensis]|uniref:Uncharacterized conserved protein YybS, DUF2232 family n=1 Tax=Alteribacillus iranensis TaxID=930128 RepID=A0A1I2C4U2_9BACI|nr:Uncharacterized conserved protein YybS, DUF2232 family [Alteribacillus iranensis]